MITIIALLLIVAWAVLIILRIREGHVLPENDEDDG